jgi:hypothetical protein
MHQTVRSSGASVRRALALCLILSFAVAPAVDAQSTKKASTESLDEKLERRIDQLESEVAELRALLKQSRAEKAGGAAPAATATGTKPKASKPAAVAAAPASKPGAATTSTVATGAYGAGAVGAAAPTTVAAGAPTTTTTTTTETTGAETAPVQTAAQDESGAMNTLASIASRVAIGGYGSVRFETDSPSDTNTTFTLRRFVLTTDANIAPRLRAYFELEFERFRKLELEQSGGASGSGFESELEFEGTNGSEISLEQAYLEFEAYKELRFQAGAMLVPIGRFNQNHDDNRWDIPRRPLVDRGAPVLPVPVAWDELGVGITGDIDGGDVGQFKYWLQVMNGAVLDPEVATLVETREGDTLLKQTAIKIGPNTGSFSIDTKDAKALAGRALWSPALGSELGGSFYWGRYTPDYLPNENVYTLALDGAADLGPIQMQAEFAYTHFAGIKTVAEGLARRTFDSTTSTESLTTDNQVVFDLAGLATEKYGYWLYLRYPFFPDFMRDTILGEPFENPQFAVFAQPEQVWFGNLVDTVSYENSQLTEFSSNDRFITRFTTGLSYRPTPLVVFSLAYEYTLTNSGKSLGSVTNYLATTANHSNSFLAGVAFGF